MNTTFEKTPGGVPAVPSAALAARPTIYRGIRMASRLESRWAFFFDECGLDWIYEPHRLRIAGSDYLPDFFLPSLTTWFEAKGRLDAHHAAKAVALWQVVSCHGQRVAIGASNGHLWVPHRAADGSVSLAGTCARCIRCLGCWFINHHDAHAQCCPHCGADDGGAGAVAAAAAAYAAGLSPGWPGGFDPSGFRFAVTDA